VGGTSVSPTRLDFPEVICIITPSDLKPILNGGRYGKVQRVIRLCDSLSDWMGEESVSLRLVETRFLE